MFRAPKVSTFLRDRWLLIALAAFALAWIVLRAINQSVVIDEADSYMMFVASSWPHALFWPSSANHVLHTLLVRFITDIFGLSELTLRTPALIGGLIYINASLWLCWLLTKRVFLQALLFTCLVFNPLVLDLLVAARGYSLAVGFLMAAFCMIAQAMLGNEEPTARSIRVKGILVPGILSSALVGLSFCANFSFAFVDAITIGVFFVWAARRLRESRLMLACACFLPGLLVGSTICGWTVAHWGKGEIGYGARSLAETWTSLVWASFYGLDVRAVRMFPILASITTKHVLAVLPLVVTALLLADTLLKKFLNCLGGSEKRRIAFAGVLLAIALLTLAAHLAAFLMIGLPLPRARTALYFVPLAMLILGTLIAVRRSLLAWMGVAVLIVHAAYFAGCLRLGYFQEWQWDADTKQIYAELIGLAQRCGPSHYVTEWRYVGALNFYRHRYHSEVLPEFTQAPFNVSAYPTNKDVYVVYEPDAREFIPRHGLKRVYFNSLTDAAIAVRTCDSKVSE